MNLRNRPPISQLIAMVPPCIQVTQSSTAMTRPVSPDRTPATTSPGGRRATRAAGDHSVAGRAGTRVSRNG